MNSCWFEKIPLDEFDENKSTLMTQLCATKWSSKIQFYRKIRFLRSVDELLKHMKGTHIIWLNEESFISPRKLPKSVPHGSIYRRAITNIVFERKRIYLYGSSKDVVARSIARLLCLKDGGAEEVRFGSKDKLGASDPLVPTTFITPRFLRNYMKANPQRRLCLGSGCYLSIEESMTLASHSEPLNVGIECMFDDQGRAFVETLAKRKSDFGTLSLHGCYFDKYYTTYSSFHFPAEVASQVSQVELFMTSSILRTSQYALPLASPARRIEYNVSGSSGFDDIESITVVPRAVTLEFFGGLSARFHTQFLRASENLRELGLICQTSNPPSEAQQNEVLDAIKGNQNLYRLERGCFNLDAIWDELLEVMGSHSSLRTVVFWVSRPTYYFQSQSVLNLHQVDTLVAFMKDNFHLDISFKVHCPWYIMGKSRNLTNEVRLQNRARVLAREPAQKRAAVFGAALTIWAAGDVSKTSALLSENTDLLCSLIGQPLSLMPVDDPERRVETRKRSVPSSPNAKNKLSKLEQ